MIFNLISIFKNLYISLLIFYLGIALKKVEFRRRILKQISNNIVEKDVKKTIAIVHICIASLLQLQGQVSLYVSSHTVEPYDIFSVQVRAVGFKDIVGMQFSMKWDSTFLTSLAVADLNLKGLRPDKFKVRANSLVVAWTDESSTFEGVSVPDSTSLFSVQFEAKQKAGSSPIEITNAPAIVELFDRTSTILTVTLKNGQVEVLDITSSVSATNQAETIQVAANAPNPLQTYTNIPITTDSARSAQLYLFDTSGKIVKVIGVQLQKGENQITLQRSLFPSKGVYYYQLFSNFETNKPLSKGYRIIVL